MAADARGDRHSGNAGSIALHRRIGLRLRGTVRGRFAFKLGNAPDTVMMLRAPG